jgi:histidine triad (HIT) family protein
MPLPSFLSCAFGRAYTLGTLSHLPMSEPTIFHKILSRDIPADILYEDDEVLAFRDIHPKAPTHLLFIPKVFVASVSETTKETEHLPGLLILKARDFAAEKGIDGYKLTYHVGKEGGQEVPYLHLHFLAQKEI